MLGNLIRRKERDNQMAVPSADHPIARLRQEYEQLWDRFWDDWRGGGLSLWDGPGVLASRMDFDDNEKEYVLRAELPGFEPEDIDVKMSGNTLTLRAEHKEEGTDKKGNGSYRRYGSFYESFTLPQGVVADQIEARYHSGVLELHLPKSEECQAKRIDVKPA